MDADLHHGRRLPDQSRTLRQPPLSGDVQYDTLGRSPIHLAAASGDCKKLQWLIDSSLGDTELPDLRRGATPLIWATVCGHVEIIKLLLSAGANPNAIDRKGHTALHYALSGFANFLESWSEESNSDKQEYRRLCLLLLRAADIG